MKFTFIRYKAHNGQKKKHHVFFLINICQTVEWWHSLEKKTKYDVVTFNRSGRQNSIIKKKRSIKKVIKMYLIAFVFLCFVW